MSTEDRLPHDTAAGEYLPIRPLSQRIGYAVKTIYNLISQGILKEGVHYFKPTKRKLLFYWPAMEAWIREGHDG
jgi:predicted DNA-binding transcriptional regulator AlpA